jgi:hypothetical protein
VHEAEDIVQDAFEDVLKKKDHDVHHAKSYLTRIELSKRTCGSSGSFMPKIVRMCGDEKFQEWIEKKRLQRSINFASTLEIATR